MLDMDKELINENLTQKDIMQFLLHSTQHVATRDELENVKQELKQENTKTDEHISKVETTLKQEISKLDDKISKVETTLKQDILKVETTLKQDILKVETSISKLDDKISKVDERFNKLQLLIIATILSIFFKDYILSLLHLAK